MSPRSTEHRAGRTPPTLALALGAALGASGPPAEAYRLYSNGDHPHFPPLRATDALRWDPEIWGPGAELPFFVADDPEWDEAGRRAETAVPFVERALAAWSAVPSADIRWSGVGVAPGPGDFVDGGNAVTVNPDPEVTYSFANIWSEWRLLGEEAPWRIVECDIVLSQETARNLDDWGLSVLIHEFGHCLGLAHAGAHPGTRSPASFPDRASPPSVWETDPQMSYGRAPEEGITEDDRTGASLLRPATDWIETTGVVRGEVGLEGAGARHVLVLALPVRDETAGGGIAAFTDDAGRFRIEGLSPDRYLLWIHPARYLAAHEGLMLNGASLEVRDRFDPVPIVVRAGAEEETLLEVRSGRTP